MSYKHYPDRGCVNLALPDHSHKLDFDVTVESAPPQVEAFLLSAGWGLATQDPTTYEQLYQKNEEVATNYMYYRWYEATAYEFWKFLTINSGNDTP